MKHVIDAKFQRYRALFARIAPNATNRSFAVGKYIRLKSVSHLLQLVLFYSFFLLEKQFCALYATNIRAEIAIKSCTCLGELYRGLCTKVLKLLEVLGIALRNEEEFI